MCENSSTSTDAAEGCLSWFNGVLWAMIVGIVGAFLCFLGLSLSALEGGVTHGVIEQGSRQKTPCLTSTQTRWRYELNSLDNALKSTVRECAALLYIDVCSEGTPPALIAFAVPTSSLNGGCPTLDSLEQGSWSLGNRNGPRLSMRFVRGYDKFATLGYYGYGRPTTRASQSESDESVTDSNESQFRIEFERPIPTVRPGDSLRIGSGCRQDRPLTTLTVGFSGENASVSGLSRDEATRIQESSDFEIEFPDGTRVCQSMRVERSSDTLIASLKWRKQHVTVRDRSTGDSIEQYSIDMPLTPCQVSRKGTTNQYFMLRGCPPLEVEVRADDYQREKMHIDLANRAYVDLYPDSMQLALVLPEELASAAAEVQIGETVVRHEALHMFFLYGRDVRDLVAKRGVTVTIIDQDLEASLRQNRNGWELFFPRTRKSVRASSLVCKQRLDVTLRTFIADSLIRTQSGEDPLSLVVGLEYRIEADAEGHNRAITTVVADSTWDTLAIELVPSRLTRQFRVFVRSYCNPDSRKEARNATFVIDKTMVKADGRGMFTFTAPTDAVDVTLELGDLSAERQRFLQDDAASGKYRIENWAKTPDACDTTTIELVDKTVTRRFRFGALGLCPGDASQPVSDLKLSFGGRKDVATDIDGAVEVTEDALAESINIALIGESRQLYRFASDSQSRGRARDTIQIDRWCSSGRDCDTAHYYVELVQRQGPHNVTLAHLPMSNGVPLSRPPVFTAELQDACDRRRILDPTSLLITPEALILPAEKYVVADRFLTLQVDGDEYYDAQRVSVELNSDRSKPPLILKRRIPGVLVLISATSALMGEYGGIVDPLTTFLADEKSHNSKLVLAHTTEGRIMGRLDLVGDLEERAIRNALDHVDVPIDSTPYLRKDLQLAREILSQFNNDVQGFKNMLLYIVPSDPLLRVGDRGIPAEYLEDFEVVVFEIRGPRSSREGIALRDPAVRHHFVTPDQLLAALQGEAKAWR